MPPYLFKRKTKARDTGKKAIFECISCAKNDVKNYAHAIKYDDLNGEEYHELVHWPKDHDCAPSATSHLARIFTKQCYDAVETSVFNTSKSETATFGAKTRQHPPQFFSLKTSTLLAQTATILEISDFFP